MSTPKPDPQSAAGFTPTGTIASSADRRRVVFATVVGTTVEWYDFFVYASAAGLVFGQLFFAPAGEQFAQILSFITVGISFLFRPLGAFLAGHLGDKYGRRLVLMLTLILMGAATTLVGVLPTYAAIGIAAPILLILLRVLQGISAGGEWGGAVLMAVEHAPAGRRGRLGAFPQIGVPIGLLLASGMLALMTGVISPGDAFLEWGWRIPFLLSFVLIIVGIIVRRAVDESPVFQEIAAPERTVVLGERPTHERGAWLLVVDEERRPLGWVEPARIGDRPVEDVDLHRGGTVARANGTLRGALDAALSSPSRRGVVVDDSGSLVGTVRAHEVLAAIEETDRPERDEEDPVHGGAVSVAGEES